MNSSVMGISRSTGEAMVTSGGGGGTYSAARFLQLAKREREVSVRRRRPRTGDGWKVLFVGVMVVRWCGDIDGSAWVNAWMMGEVPRSRWILTGISRMRRWVQFDGCAEDAAKADDMWQEGDYPPRLGAHSSVG